MADPTETSNSIVSEGVSTIAEAAPVAAAVVAALPADPIAAAIAGIEAWFEEHIPNSVFSRDTFVHNRVFNAVGEIKSALSTVKE